MLALATKVLTDYGKVLAQVQPGLHGLPELLLPHSKQQIRGAILMLLENLDAEQTAIKESLARGYVYLAQFVPDEDCRADQLDRRPHQQPHVGERTGAPPAQSYKKWTWNARWKNCNRWASVSTKRSSPKNKTPRHARRRGFRRFDFLLDLDELQLEHERFVRSDARRLAAFAVGEFGRE